MQPKQYYYPVFFVILISLWSCKSPQNNVYFIPTLHGIHKVNENYTYDSLKQIISRINPDLIAVEIRQEDIARDSAYLGKNYPYEMRMMKYWFPGTPIVGFDWLGHDIEGKSIPDNYWKEISAVKKMERDLNADSVFAEKCTTCDTFKIQRIELLKNLSLQEILKSRDSLLTKQFYECLAEQLKGSKYEQLLTFYDTRNDKILANIKNIIMMNKYKRIVIVTGDDHYIYLKDKFPHEKHF